MAWPPSLLRLPFLRKSKLVAWKQGRCAEKASAGKEFAQEIPSVLPQGEAGLSGGTQFGIRNVEFGNFTSFFPFRIPQSAFRI
jgi:hypothetical protein